MALPINIESLLKNKEIESNRIEYKRSWNPRECIRTICAFANDIENLDGGYIVIGVEEKQGVPILPVKGLKPTEINEIEKDLLNKCHFIEPFYFPRIEKCEYEGKTLLVLWVTAGDGRPYKASKEISKNQSEKYYYIRHGSKTIQADGISLKELFENSSRIPFDDRENPFATVSDIDLGLLREHLKKVGSSLYELSTKMNLIEVAQSMKLLSGPKERLFPRNIALLMFSENIEKYFPYAYIEIVDMPDPTGKNMTEKTFRGPIQYQLSEALQYIQNYMISEMVIKKEGVIETERLWNYPINAIKEILANAVYHRDYQIKEPITLVRTPSYIEIKSFPGLNRSITDEMIKNLNIRSAGEYRNRRIGNFLKELRLTEGRNTGIPLAIEQLKNNKSDLPLFITDLERQSLVVRIPVNKKFLNNNDFQIRINPGKQRTPDELKSNIMSLLSTGNYSASMIARKLGYKGVSNAMRNALQDLINNKRIKVEGSFKSCVYSLY